MKRMLIIIVLKRIKWNTFGIYLANMQNLYTENYKIQQQEFKEYVN